MDTLLHGIPGVVAYIDGSLITGPSDEEHPKALHETLSRLDKSRSSCTVKEVRTHDDFC